MMNSNSVCYDCLKPLIKKQSTIKMNHAVIGDYSVPYVIHWQCEECGSMVIEPEEALRIEIVGTKLHILAYLKDHGAQPSQTLKNIVLCEEDTMYSALTELEKENKVTKEQIGELTIYKSIVKETKNKGFFSWLKKLIKR